MSKLTFTRKPMPVLVEHRAMFKITQILLILYLSSRGKKSSLIRLHLFSWAMKDEKRKKILSESAKENIILFDVWGVDPAVNISLQFALSEKLIEKVSLSYKLTKHGENYIRKVDERYAFQADYTFLKALGARITEGMVLKIVGEWE